MKKGLRFKRRDVVSQAIHNIILYLNDDISVNEFSSNNKKILNKFTSQMALELDANRLVKRFS